MRHSRPSKKWLKILVFIILITAGWLVYSSARYNYLISTPFDAKNLNQVSVIIKKGDSINDITGYLSAKNLLIDAGVFKEYVKTQGIDRKIIAGRFMISPSQTIPEIAGILTSTEKSQVVLTITEGSTIQDIDKKLTDNGLIQAGGFIQAVKEFKNYSKYTFLNESENTTLIYPLEGYLFPDTYYIDPTDFIPDNLISMMLRNFENRVRPLLKNSPRSTHDITIMASLLEKEVRTPKDLPIVSGILWKRLDEKWQIGADAALLYLKNDREIDYRDLQEDSEYNLRKHPGLPPGPICNPGLRAIEAAIQPEKSPYYYYLTKPETGEVVYATTNDEHNSNKAKYLY